MVSLFLFPHQDDEYGVFFCIERAIKKENDVYCLYFTDGGDDSGVRNAESTRVLKSLGVHASNILFFGDLLKVPDGKLLYYLSSVNSLLRIFFGKLKNIEEIFIPAWEGGHPDHDALHAVTVKLANELNLNNKIYQFSLYNNYQCVGPFFKLMKPLTSNGEVEYFNIPFRNRLNYISKSFAYKSQWKSWVGLFPFFFYKYLFIGKQELQRVNMLFKRPHNGVLYYERRGFEKFEILINIVTHKNS